MKTQLVGIFENAEEMVFEIGKQLERKGMKGFEVKSSPNGCVYIESDNENALALAFDIKCRIEIVVIEETEE
jgi:hypothetical protein